MELPPFAPARGLAHPYAQTLFGVFARRAPAVAARRERWTTFDGDCIEVDLVEPSFDASLDPPAPRSGCTGSRPRGFVILLHGLEGSSRSPYIARTLARARARDLLGVAPSYRGCGDAPNRYAASYHSGHTDDVRLVVREVARRWPGLRGGVVGFSLGANVAVKWLADEGRGAPDHVACGVAVSSPFDLGACADHLDAPQRWPLRAHFLRSLKAKALEKARRFPHALDARAIAAARTLREYDDAVTAPLNGFRDAEDYYRRSSAGGRLAEVRLPTLLISAADDPLIPERLIPRETARANDALVLAATARGGHVGFVAGSALAPRFWAEERSVEFVERAIGADSFPGVLSSAA